MQLSSPKHPRPVLVGAAVLVVALLVAVAFVALRDSQQASTQVGADGFSIQVGAYRVSGDAAVAPSGTEVLVRVEDSRSAPTEYVELIAPSLEIRLGGELQPATPVTVELVLTEEQVAAMPNDEPFLLTNGDGPDGVELTRASWDGATRTLTATADHLSWFDPVGFLLGPVVDRLQRFFEVAVFHHVDEPSCTQDELDLGNDRVLSPGLAPDDSAFVCLSREGDEIIVSLYANGPNSWTVSSTPDANYRLPTPDDPLALIKLTVGTAAAAVVDLQPTILVPGSVAQLAFPIDTPPSEVQLEVSTMLGLIGVLIDALGIFLPDEALEVLGHAGCVLGLIGAAESPEVTTEVVVDAIECMVGAVVSGGFQAAFGAILLFPAAVAMVGGSLAWMLSPTQPFYTFDLFEPIVLPELPLADAGRTEIHPYLPWVDADGQPLPEGSSAGASGTQQGGVCGPSGVTNRPDAFACEGMDPCFSAPNERDAICFQPGSEHQTLLQGATGLSYQAVDPLQYEPWFFNVMVEGTYACWAEPARLEAVSEGLGSYSDGYDTRYASCWVAGPPGDAPDSALWLGPEGTTLYPYTSDEAGDLYVQLFGIIPAAPSGTALVEFVMY